MQRDAGGHAVKQIPLDVVHQQYLRRDAVELIPLSIIELQAAGGRDLPQVVLQYPAQFRRQLVDAAVKDLAGGLHHDHPAVLLLRDAAQKQILLPQAAEPCADAHGLVDGGVQALHTRSDKKSVKAHFAGNGVGDHIADHHPVAALLQALQCMGDFFCAVNSEDIQIKAQQAAQGMSRFGDAGKAHDGIELGVVLGQLHGAQHIIDRDLDIHHRQVGDLPDHGGGAAAGDDAVVGVRRHLLHDGLAVLEIAGVYIQLNVRVSLHGLLHGGAHPVVGGNAEDAGMCFDHNQPSVHS